MRRCPQGMPMAENPENKQRWYALRVTYGREMLVKGYLDGIGVESYIPMHFARRTYGERTRKVWEPLIHNLLFIRTSALRLKEIKASTTLPIRYIMDRGVFAGIEGRYIRHKGHSKVAVAIKDIATALTAYVPLRYIEKINQQILLPTHTQSAQR